MEFIDATTLLEELRIIDSQNQQKEIKKTNRDWEE